jgi:hypothetical protein
VHTLRFIRRAHATSASPSAQIGELLSLWQDRKRPSRLVKALAQVAHPGAGNQKAQALLAMKSTLEHLVHCCHGDDRPECPILETLAGSAGNGSNTSARRQPTAARLK